MSNDIKESSNRRAIQIARDIYDLLRDDFTSQRRTMSFSQFVSNKLNLMYEKEKWVAEMYPELNFVSIDNNAVIIRESNRNEPARDGLYEIKIIETVKNAVKIKRFECDRCEPSTDCSHVMMTQALKISSSIH